MAELTPSEANASASIFSPYPGLRPFRARTHDRPGEEHLFFGRERHVDMQIEILSRRRFLGVIGVSGCGKSSLVNCGLLPALHGGYMEAGPHWRVVRFRPGAEPMNNLAEALHRQLYPENEEKEKIDLDSHTLVETVKAAGLNDKINVLVVVDQFEELFRFMDVKGSERSISPDEAKRFVSRLLEATEQWACPLYVVITMRSDFLGDCAQFEGLPEAINKGLFLVPRMRQTHKQVCEPETNGQEGYDEIRDAIEGPIAVANRMLQRDETFEDERFADTTVRYDCHLLERILDDVSDDPAQLPVLQHALNRTWRVWWDEMRDKVELKSSEEIEARHYDDAGGIRNALNRHADDIYDNLTPNPDGGPPTDEARNKWRYCERIFKALTDVTVDGRAIRRPTSVGDLVILSGAPDKGVVLEIIEAFRAGGSFLHVVDPRREDELGDAPYTTRDRSGEYYIQDDDLVDLSHESLMTHWSKLAGWIKEEQELVREFRKWLARAEDYDSVERNIFLRYFSDPLLRRNDLRAFKLWYKRCNPSSKWYARNLPRKTDNVEENAVPGSISNQESLTYTLPTYTDQISPDPESTGISIDEKMEKLLDHSNTRKVVWVLIGVLIGGLFSTPVGLFVAEKLKNRGAQEEVIRARKRANALVVANHADRYFNLYYPSKDSDNINTTFLLARLAMKFNEESDGAIQDHIHQVLRKIYNMAAEKRFIVRDPRLIFRADTSPLEFNTPVFHPDEDILAIAEYRSSPSLNNIRLLKGPDYNYPDSDDRNLEEHQTKIEVMAFHPDSGMHVLLAADFGGNIIKWKYTLDEDQPDIIESEPEVIDSHENSILDIAFSSETDSVWFAATSSSGLFLYDEHFARRDSFKMPEGLNPTNVVFTEVYPQLLLFSDSDGGIWRCIDWKNGLNEDRCSEFQLPDPKREFEHHTRGYAITSMEIWKDTLVTGSQDYSIRLWSIENDSTFSLRFDHVLSGSEMAVQTIAISSNGDVLAADRANRILLWKKTEFRLRPTIFRDILYEKRYPIPSNSFINSVIFTPSNTHFISSSDFGTIRKWKTNPRELVDDICEAIQDNFELTVDQWDEFVEGIDQSPYYSSCTQP